ncbi:MAG: Holliday junction resolvase RuvX [Gammaproteobacteria bacterium]|nr:Holliday junction resolvase RuvX [Gammaproteobacteria bacterium]
MSGEQTLLGFDYGSRRIGVAMAQQPGNVTRRLKFVNNSPTRPDWPAIDRLVAEWLPNALVVGLSRHGDGSDSPVTRAIRKFAGKLGDRFDRPVYFEDERLSSVAAREALLDEGLPETKIARHLDSESARQILLSWLEHAARE